MSENMNLTLKIWRQAGPDAKGELKEYKMTDVSPDMSFLEMLDVLNEKLVEQKQEPVVFDHDCREGICGACSLVINGRPHGPVRRVTTCQLHMRKFKDGDTIYIEPYRAKAFPVIKDLMVDRKAYDRIQAAGGFISVNTSGNPTDANSILIKKENADRAFAAASCIGCGACAAACPNASAMLFMSAKAARREKHMLQQMDHEGFGNCSNTGACEVECPKGVSLENIARMNREYLAASFVPES